MNRTLLQWMLAACLLAIFTFPTLAQSAPIAPSGLRTVPTTTSVALYWNTSPGATSYNIYRSTTSGGEGSTPLVVAASVTVDGTTDVDWTNTGLPPNTVYYYQVTAVNSAGESAKSNEAAATTGGSQLTAPIIKSATAGNAQVTVQWYSVSGATSYNIFRSFGGGSNYVLTTSTSATTYTDIGLTNGVTYSYFVVGVNLVGDGYTSGTVSATPEAPAFTLGASPSSLSLNQGSSGTSTVSLTNLYGFTGAVTLTATGLPSGVTAGFSPSSISGSATGTLTLTAAPTAAAGNYTVTVTGTSGSLTATKSITLTVVSNPILTSIVVSPSTASVVYGATQQFAATGDDQFGNVLATQPTFTWTASGGGAISSVGLYKSSVPGGPYMVTVTSGSTSGTASVSVTSFALTATPAAVSVNQGTSGTTSIGLTNIGGFNGIVTLAVSGLPFGVTASFSPGSISGSTPSTLTLAASPTATAGTYQVTVTGSSGSLVVTTTATLIVASNPILTSIVVSPSSATLVIQTTEQFFACGCDQFGNVMQNQLALTWSTTGGSISPSGFYTATTVGNPLNVTATSGQVSGSATVDVVSGPTIAIAPTANPNPVIGTTTNLSALGASLNGEQTLTYTWSTPAGDGTTFSINGTNAAKNTVATFIEPGLFEIDLTIMDQNGITATSSVEVVVNQTLTSINVTPAQTATDVGDDVQFAAESDDQFGDPMFSQGTFAWLSSGGGTIDPSLGLFTAAAYGGPFTVTAQTGGASGTALITVAPAVSISNVTPDIISPGTSVNITGTGFSGATSVAFGPSPATSFSVISPTSIQAVVPNNWLGPMSVSAPGGAASSEQLLWSGNNVLAGAGDCLYQFSGGSGTSDGATIPYQTTLADGAYSAYGATAWSTGGADPVSLSGQINAVAALEPNTLPNAAPDYSTMPTNAIVYETSYGQWFNFDSVFSGSCNDGLGETSTSGSGLLGGYDVYTTVTSQNLTGSILNFTASPSASVVGIPNSFFANPAGGGGVDVTFGIAEYPITVAFGGGNQDTHGTWNILVGEQCQVRADGIPPDFTVTTCTWSVSGDTVSGFYGAPPDSGASGYPLPVSSQILNPPPSAYTQAYWYWSDNGGKWGSWNYETVSVAGTIISKDGTLILPFNASIKVKVWAPRAFMLNPVTALSSPTLVDGLLVGITSVNGKATDASDFGLTFDIAAYTPTDFLPEYSGNIDGFGITKDVQLVNVSEETNNPLSLSTTYGHFCLDNLYDYGDGGGAGSGYANQYLSFTDAPNYSTSITLGYVGVQVNFKTFIMYTPPSIDEIPTMAVPIYEVDWHWTAKASQTLYGVVTCTGSTHIDRAAQSSNFPTWNNVYKNSGW
jgi:hypothetical protein